MSSRQEQWKKERGIGTPKYIESDRARTRKGTGSRSNTSFQETLRAKATSQTFLIVSEVILLEVSIFPKTPPTTIT